MNNTIDITRTDFESDKRIVRKAGSFFVNPESIPWTSFPFPDTQFRLLNVDFQKGSMTLILRAGPDALTPLHKHIGAAELFVLNGWFSYEEGKGTKGDYVYEAGGVIHVAEAGNGVEALILFHGPIIGLDDSYSVTGVIDAEMVYSLAKANGATAHIDKARAAMALDV
ncbi:cupin domain-containing protein [Paraburkholderia acidicola]|uniref:Cupin domain-containing protein n=1 Tax=Paraburkholderia acidicola TaxID=1912599 RepID=A0ABV1LWR9_9BURK